MIFSGSFPLAIILSSPSGGGKTSLIKLMLDKSPRLFASTSATTRAIRPCEVSGKDYIFLTSKVFYERIKSNYFLEWAHVFDSLYGTPAEPVDKAAAQGYDIIFDIDWQGRQRLIQALTFPCVSIFILPPSLDHLRQRLSQRGMDRQTVTQRMEEAQQHIAKAPTYDYVIANHDLSLCALTLQNILKVERLRHYGKAAIKPLLETLLVQR